MLVDIAGDIRIHMPTQEVVDWCEENLVFRNPVYLNLIRRGKQDVIQRNHVQPTIKAYAIRNDAYIIPFGCLYGIWGLIKGSQVQLDFSPSEKTSFAYMPSKVNLFDYQERAVNELIKAKGGLLKAGCGAGKTYMGIELIRRLGYRFLWICGKKDLLMQTYNNFKQLYPELDIGLTTDGEIHFGKDGTITTVQTMVNVDYRLYETQCNIVLTDECHHIMADPHTRQQYAKVLARCKARYKYGLTATPSRQDGLTNMIYAYVGMSPRGTFRPTCEISDKDTQSLTATYETFDLDTPTSYSYLAGDGSFDYMSLVNYLCQNEYRTEKICKKIYDLVYEGRKIAVLSLRVENVIKINDTLLKMGVRSACVTGKSTNKQRESSIRTPDNWDVIVATVSLFKEGIDIKALDTVFLVLPIKDTTGIIQARGRAERPLEGKKEPKFIYAFDTKIEYCQTAERKIRRTVSRRK